MTRISPAAEPSWSRLRWSVVIGGLVALQCALMFGLVRWPTLPLPSNSGGSELVIQLAPRIPGAASDPFDSDPRLFALPDGAGFSGTARRALPSPEYRLVEWKGQVVWLGITNAASRLGTPPPTKALPIAAPRAPLVSGPVEPSSTPLLLGPGNATQIQGGLAGRAYQATGRLLPVIGTDILAPTVIELFVSEGGDVMRARLISSCGNREADLDALNWARHLQFKAIGTDSTLAGSTPSTWISGELQVFWRVEPGVQ